jgi:hypothetical protein
MGGRPYGKRTEVQLTTGERLTCDSALEARVVSDLDREVVDFEFHPDPMHYTVTHRYTTDLKIFPLDGGDPFFVEVKGYWPADERNLWWKMRQQHPEVDIRLALQNPNQPISKGSKTSLGKWATKKGITWTSLAQGACLPKTWTKAL